MRYKTAFVKNIETLFSAYEAMENADEGIPRMGLVYGVPGAGKTMGITRLMNDTNAIMVRAAPTWTLTSMLGEIMVEIGIAEERSADKNRTAIINHMREESRPLFVDEIDMFTNPLVKPHRAGAIIECLRTFHDLSGMPVMLIGMAGVERHLAAYKQVTSRISQWIRFDPASFDDARTLADTICEVHVLDDLLKNLHGKAKGNMRLMTVGLSKIERAAKGNGLKEIGMDRWGQRSFGLGGDVNGGGHDGE